MWIEVAVQGPNLELFLTKECSCAKSWAGGLQAEREIIFPYHKLLNWQWVSLALLWLYWSCFTHLAICATSLLAQGNKGGMLTHSRGDSIWCKSSMPAATPPVSNTHPALPHSTILLHYTHLTNIWRLEAFFSPPLWHFQHSSRSSWLRAFPVCHFNGHKVRSSVGTLSPVVVTLYEPWL